jgi:hypothetical protein
MKISGNKFKRWIGVGAAMMLALTLGGCFDLGQKVAIGRDGSGSYDIVIAAGGLFGDALKEKKADILDRHMKAVTRTWTENGKTFQSAHVDFKSLSELHLSNEVISVEVLDRAPLGLGPAHVRFRRTFLVDNARRTQESRNASGEDLGRNILASMFGDHTYTFSVWLPGSIVRIAPVKIRGVEIKPEVSGDFYHGHTIVWRMPLDMMLGAKMLTFEADFSAYGFISDATSTLDDKIN